MSKDNLHVLRQAVQNDLVKEVQEGDLCLFKYTRNCMFKSCNWGSITKKARGIILHLNGSVACRPFDKFFNLGEVLSTANKVVYHKLSKQSVEITEKLDGSLINLWCHSGEWHTSTTGSFHSPQAEYALAMLYERYPEFVQLNKNYTYLFELIGVGWDRKVIKYREEALVLLTAFQNVWEEKEMLGDTLDLMAEGMGFRRPRVVTIDPYSAIHGNDIGENEEGYVFRFSDGSRLKIKSMLYVRLHRLLNSLTPRKLVDIMRSGNYNEEMWEVPEHIKDDFDDLSAALIQIKEQVWFEADEYWKNVVDPTNFKETAIYIQQNVPNELHSLLYSRMREKAEDHIVWDIVLERAKNTIV